MQSLSTNRRLVASRIGIAIMAGLVATQVHAQAVSRAAPATSSSDDTLAEIIVTAQRRSEDLQSVPVAVTPISAQDLATRKLEDLTQLTLAAPSLQITTDNAFTLRGVGSQIFTEQIDSSVGVSVDDVSLGVPLFMSNGIFNDVAQIAVLDGPQGLLFGRNASAGLLQIVTNKPVLNQLSGDAGLEYDDRDTSPGGHFGMVARGTLNLPVSANSALRINVLGSDQDPVVKQVVDTSPNAQLNQSRVGLKAKYLWLPTDDTTVYVIGDYSRERGIGGIWDRSWRVADPAGLDYPAIVKDGITAGPDNLRSGVSGPDYRSVDTGGVSINISQRLNSALTLSNIFAWRQYALSLNLDTDYTSAPLVDTNFNASTYKQFSDELRLAVDLPKLDGQVGFYTFASFTHANSLLLAELLGPPPAPVLLGGDYVAANFERSVAAFGQFNYHVSSDLRLLAGARVTHDLVGVNTTEDEGTYIIPLEGPTGYFTFSHGNTNFSFKVGAEYDLAPGSMLYLTYGTGYKGPSYPANLSFPGQDPYVKPETVRDVEGGIKTMMLNDKLRLNISGFYEKFKDFQAPTFTPENELGYTGNAGGARSAGVEVNATARPTRDLTINLGFIFSDSYFTDNITGCFPGQSLTSCPNGTSFQGAGLAMPAAAKVTSTLEGAYDFHIGSNTLTAEANWYHRTGINFDANGDPLTRVGPIDILGASLTYRLQQMEFAAFCKNCSNVIFPTFLGREPGDTGSVVQSFSYNSVRTIGVSANYKF
jgi:iron complex outermembrane recepter protein